MPSPLCCEGAYKRSGAKKTFRLRENEITKVIEKPNRNRCAFTPTDRRAHYETVTVNGFPRLIVRDSPRPSERAILCFFGGALALGTAAHNNAQKEALPQPRHAAAVSPREVPWKDAGKARMQVLNEKGFDHPFQLGAQALLRTFWNGIFCFSLV